MNGYEEAKQFLRNKFQGDIQMFNTRNIVGNDMDTIYEDIENGIQIDYCWSWHYVEVFGFDQSTFDRLVSACGYQ